VASAFTASRAAPAARSRQRVTLAAAVLDAIHADMPLSGDLLVMVNGMGGTPLLELYVLFNEVRQYLEGRGARVPGAWWGNYNHQPGDAGLLGDGVSADGHAHQVVGLPSGHACPAVGTLAHCFPVRRRNPWMLKSSGPGSSPWPGVIDEQRGPSDPADAAIGDADHGINLSRGVHGPCSVRWNRPRPPTPGGVLTVTGSTLISRSAAPPARCTGWPSAGRARRWARVTDVDLPGCAVALDAARGRCPAARGGPGG